jgi:hypothetical protein
VGVGGVEGDDSPLGDGTEGSDVVGLTEPGSWEAFED